jgi:hypothetical protein
MTNPVESEPKFFIKKHVDNSFIEVFREFPDDVLHDLGKVENFVFKRWKQNCSEMGSRNCSGEGHKMYNDNDLLEFKSLEFL